MDLQKYEQLLHDATVIFCKKNGYWFYGSKNDDEQAILVKNRIGLYQFKGLKYPQIINLATLFNEIFAEQISDFSHFNIPTIESLEAKSVLLKTIDEYKELIYHATILFCQSNDVVIHTDDYMEQRNWENSEDLECLFHGMPFVHFDALLADDIFDDIRDRDLNYDDRQDEISAEYIEKKFNELKPREMYHFLNRSLQTKEVKSTRTKI